MKVEDIMSAHIITARYDMPFREVWRTIFKRHVNAIPVVDKEKKLVGIITKEDLLKKLYPDYQEFVENFASLTDFEHMEGKLRDLTGLKAKDVLCKRVIYARTFTPIMRALSRMIVRRVNQLPVLSSEDTVIGMVTKGDIFYALFKKHFEETKHAGVKKSKQKSPQPKKIKRKKRHG